MFNWFVDYEFANVFPHKLTSKVRAWTRRGASKKALKLVKKIAVNRRFRILEIRRVKSRVKA